LFACLRINRVIAGSTARLTTGLPGSALAGRDSHPLDDKPNFMKSSLHSFRTSRAWSHPPMVAPTPDNRGPVLSIVGNQAGTDDLNTSAASGSPDKEKGTKRH
jgi:hypothetical protein